MDRIHVDFSDKGAFLANNITIVYASPMMPVMVDVRTNGVDKNR